MISKNGTLNIYIGMDISQSITEDGVKITRNGVVTLIKKVRP